MQSCKKMSIPCTAPYSVSAMFKILLVGLVGITTGQSGASCGSGFVYNTAVSSCLPAASSSNCCDATLVSCQDAIKLCMANPSAGTNCQALACPTPLPSPTCCDPALLACQTTIRLCLMNTSNIQACQALACPTASVSPIRTQSTASVSSTATSKQTDATVTPRAEPSASNTPRQADSSVTSSATASPSVTMKQTDASASNTPRQADGSATTTYKQTEPSATMKPADPSPSGSMKPTASVYPTRFIKYSFSIRPRPSQFVFPLSPPASVESSLIFPKANHTRLRDPTKLQELQIILACILQLPLESIVITSITANAVDLPFDSSIPRLNSNGEIVCITLPSVFSAQGAPLRNLQASDTTVSYNILNANNLFMVDKNTFATSIASDPNMLSFASSVGSTDPTAIPPYMLFTRINPDPSTVPAQPVSAGQIIGGIFGGILVFGILAVAVFAVIRLSNRTRPITATKKPSVAVSNPLNCSHDSHVVFSPAPTRRTAY